MRRISSISTPIPIILFLKRYRKFPRLSPPRADGQKALALTDNGNLYGAIEFYKKSARAYGSEADYRRGFLRRAAHALDKQHRVDDRHSRLILLAKIVRDTTASYSSSRNPISKVFTTVPASTESSSSDTATASSRYSLFRRRTCKSAPRATAKQAKETLAWYKNIRRGLFRRAHAASGNRRT